MPDFLEQPNQNPFVEPSVEPQARPQALNMGKVFGYMALGLLGTALFTAIFGAIVWFGCGCTVIGDGVVEISNYTLYLGLSGLTIIPMIGILICSVLAGTFLAKTGVNSRSKSVAVPFAIYAACIGYVLGLLVPFLPWQVLATTLGVTIALFGILALIGGLSKGNLNPLIMCASGLGGGLVMMVLFNLLLGWIFPGFMTVTSWAISLGFFAILMLTTIWDVWNIKMIMNQNDHTPNLALFCAFRLYVDFIALFIRLLYFVLIMFTNNRD